MRITKSVKLKVEIDSSGAVTGSGEVVDATDKAKKSTGLLDKGFKELKKTMLGLAAGYGVFTLMKNNQRITIDFTSAISDLSAITGATGKDLKFLSDAAREMGATTTLSATQAATAFKLVASAKPDLLENAAALKEVTAQAILLAEASGSTLPEAANTVGAALNQFGAEADQAARFVNVLAAGAKFGASEIGFTSMALKEAGTVAKTVGISFEETNAAIQQLASVSIKGSQAGTQLRNVLLKLSTQSDNSINPSIVGLSKAMENLKAKQLPLVDLQKLFGLESIAAGKALIDQSAGLEELTKKLTGTNTAMVQAAVKVDNLEGDIKKLGSAWEEFNLKIGTSTSWISRWAVRASTELLLLIPELGSAFTKLGDAIQKAFGVEPDWTGYTDGSANAIQSTESLTNSIVKLDAMIKARKANPLIDSDTEVGFTIVLEKRLEVLNDKLAKTKNEFYLMTQIGIGTDPLLKGDVKADSLVDQPQISNKLLDQRQAQIDASILALEQQFFTEEELLGASYSRRDAMINSANLSDERTNELKLNNQKKYFSDLDKIAKKSEDNRKRMAWQSATSIAGSLAYVTGVFAGESKKAFKINQAVQATNAFINTAEQVTKSLANPVKASFIALAGAAQIHKILAASPGGTSGSSTPSISGVEAASSRRDVPPAQVVEKQPQPINIYVTGYTNNDLVRSDIIPVIKEALDNGDTLFNEDSAQVEIIRRAG